MSQVQNVSTLQAVPAFPAIAYKGTPVLTTEMLAQAYGVNAKQIRQNFNNNRSRFVEGKHFFSITGGELNEFRLGVEKIDAQISPKVRVLTLWTDRGSARHAKMLESDTAWDVHELLEDTFFSVNRMDALTATELPPAPQSLTPSTPADRAPLRALVHAWATVTGVHHAALWPQVKAHFQLARIDDLPLEWLPDALAFAQGKIDQHRKLHVLPSAPDIPALPRGKRAPGPVERQIMALSVEIDEAFGGLRTQLGDVMRRLRNVVRPLYGPTYDALGWHSHAGFSVDSLAGTLSQGHWDSLRHADDALADARNYAMVFKTLARLHGM